MHTRLKTATALAAFPSSTRAMARVTPCSDPDVQGRTMTIHRSGEPRT